MVIVFAGNNKCPQACGSFRRIFKDIQLAELQHVIDNCSKNYPTQKKIKVLFNQLYDFAMMHDICNKDYSGFVDVARYKDKNPNKFDRNKFSKEELAKLWTMRQDKYYQIVLMLLYNRTRISEFLNLKKEHVHLKEQYFEVIESKTENGIRKVPIADKLLPSTKRSTNLVRNANIFSTQKMVSISPIGKSSNYSKYLFTICSILPVFRIVCSVSYVRINRSPVNIPLFS